MHPLVRQGHAGDGCDLALGDLLGRLRLADGGLRRGGLGVSRDLAEQRRVLLRRGGLRAVEVALALGDEAAAVAGGLEHHAGRGGEGGAAGLHLVVELPGPVRARLPQIGSLGGVDVRGRDGTAVAGALEGRLVLVLVVERHAVLLAGMVSGRADPAVAAVAGALELPVDAVALEGARVAALLVAVDAARRGLELLAVHAEGLGPDVDERLRHEVHVACLDADRGGGQLGDGVDAVDDGELDAAALELALELLDVVPVLRGGAGEDGGLLVLVRVLGAHGGGGHDALVAVAVDAVGDAVLDAAHGLDGRALLLASRGAGAARLRDALEDELDERLGRFDRHRSGLERELYRLVICWHFSDPFCRAGVDGSLLGSGGVAGRRRKVRWEGRCSRQAGPSTVAL